MLSALTCSNRASSRTVRKTGGEGAECHIHELHSKVMKHKSALSQRHPVLLVVFFPPWHESSLQSPLTGSASANSQIYSCLEVRSIPRGMYLKEQLLPAHPIPYASCTSPEHQMHMGVFIFLSYLNKAIIHFLFLYQLDVESIQLKIQALLGPERIFLLQNSVLFYGHLSFRKCPGHKSEMPVVRKSTCRLSRSCLNYMALSIIPAYGHPA